METAQEVVDGMLDKQRLRTFVLGGLAGALAGILFAPRSGKELRETLASRAGEARERGRETYFDAQEKMQERVSRASERPPRSGETYNFQDDDVTDPLPALEPDAPEPGPEPLVETPAETSLSPPPLRDVSWDSPRDERGGASRPDSGEDPEELRRRIQETRSRLRARLEAPEEEDSPGGRDV
jgi:gas vesicle protein